MLYEIDISYSSIDKNSYSSNCASLKLLEILLVKLQYSRFLIALTKNKSPRQFEDEESNRAKSAFVNLISHEILASCELMSE
ncbi:15812_t:CDS:2, partial [Gigaspora margarita]